MKLVILVGSGLSIGAGYPGTQALTEVVRSGHGVFRHTDSSYVIGHGGDSESHKELAMVVVFLQRLQAVAERYYSRRPERPISYEDLAYLVGQFADNESDEYD